jgi:hypothetical protein
MSPAYLGHLTGRNKQHEFLGYWTLSREFELGNVRLPYADEDAKTRSDLLIAEVTGAASTDDLAMALWFIKANHHALKIHVPGMLATRMKTAVGRARSWWGPAGQGTWPGFKRTG